MSIRNSRNGDDSNAINNRKTGNSSYASKLQQRQ